MRILFSLLLVWCTMSLFAQVAAPDFLCTRTVAGAEVLSWNNTPNTCGPFEATEIYSSLTANGPFTLIAEITDPVISTFDDPNPTGEVRFYYLRYRYTCPGATVINSDTLDNRIPRTPNLLYVGVEGDDIVINWEASVSPEVSGYIILEQTPTANIPIDTVFGATDYRLPILPGDAPAGGRSFLLVAIDPCGNDSPQGRVASAMDLDGSGGFGCSETITLNIDQAANAQYAPIASHELFVSVDGGSYTLAGTFAPNAVTVDYPDANDGESLCFYVEAVLANGLGRARSLEFCLTVAFNQPVREFSLYGAEINAAGELILQFDDNVLQPTAVTGALLVTQANGQTGVLDLPGFSFSGGTLVVPPLNPPVGPGDQLSLRVVDDCMREVITNGVAPIFLTGRTLLPGQNILDWTPFDNALAGTFSYTLSRAFVSDPAAAAGAMFTPIAQDISAISFVDDVTVSEDIACYQVSVRYLPEGTGPTQSAIFRSNIVCVLPRTEVFIPNVFSPRATQAENLVFLPRFSRLPDAAGYVLKVYDRWGGLLFESTDPSLGWSGDSKGQALPVGTYFYQLRYVNSFGETIERAGTVNLLR